MRAGQLSRLGIATVGDLLRLLPTRYEDRRSLTTIARLAEGVPASIAARVVSAGPAITPRRRRRIFRAVFEDDTGRIAALWFRFRAAALQALLRPGARVLVHGVPTGAAGRRELLHPELEPLGQDGERSGPVVRPVYPATEGLSQATLRTLVRRALAAALAGLEDPLAPGLRARLDLPGLAESLRAVHTPDADRTGAHDPDAQSPWRRRLIFDELFALQLQLALRRRRNRSGRAPRARMDAGAMLRRLAGTLPFPLTAAQARVCREILDDMGSPHPMQRLLHGDVGSGKTLVAALAVLAACAGGGQAALLVPTELLAEQHFLTLGPLMVRLGVRAGLLTASMPPQRRARMLAELAAGRQPFVIGTHALLEGRVRFSRLALAIVDEQHRFGVRQRLALREKGAAPDLLVMTATPIPRSLALTLYGDLDLSTIDELPPGRRPVATTVVGESGRAGAWELVRSELARGRRAYVVCPLVEEGGEEDPLAAVRTAAALQSQFGAHRVGIVHGRMPIAERVRAMERFRSGEAPLLVATTVIEVGLDVPEATVMVVERAERFGLAQLHQLRGRVGRGPDGARCILIAGPRPTPEARERLAVLARTADGFAVAEADLAIRGAGQLAGTRQAGAAGLRFADFGRDGSLLAAAWREARIIVDGDPLLERAEHRSLRPLLGREEDEFGAAG